MTAAAAPEEHEGPGAGVASSPDGAEAAWDMVRLEGRAPEHHEPWPGGGMDRSRRAVALRRVTRPAVVFGSTHPVTDAERERCAGAGLDVVRRGSGGGAVLVTPGDPVWIDLWVPRSDPLWVPDVAASPVWLGELWVAALTSLGATGLGVHRGPMLRSRWSDRICFAGLAAGEVVDGAGRKVVGVAQRRGREGAWFQTACVRRWDPAVLLDVTGIGDAVGGATAAGVAAELALRVRGAEEIVPGVPVEDLERAVVAALERHPG